MFIVVIGNSDNTSPRRLLVKALLLLSNEDSPILSEGTQEAPLNYQGSLFF